MFNGRSFITDQVKRSIKWIIEDSSGMQEIEVTGAQLLYLWRRPGAYDQNRDTPLEFKWTLVETSSKNVALRRAFKRDFQSSEEPCDFTILPFQLPDPDGLLIPTRFDLSVTFTRLASEETRGTVSTPRPDQELLEDSPSVIKVVTMVGGEEREILSSEVVESTWRISSGEIREDWLSADEYKEGRIVVVVKQPLTVHIAYEFVVSD